MHLRQIDGLSLPDHSFLTQHDRCWYITEFTARKGFSYSDGNRLILDLQLDADASKIKDSWQQKKKQAAIIKAADLMHRLLSKDQLLKPTWVPVPPSKTKQHISYDNRVIEILDSLKAKEVDFDWRELISQINDRDSAKKSTEKRDADSLYQNYSVNEPNSSPHPKIIIIFDDVVTTGATFRAMERKLSERFHAVPIRGLFLARRVPEQE